MGNSQLLNMGAAAIPNARFMKLNIIFVHSGLRSVGEKSPTNFSIFFTAPSVP